MTQERVKVLLLENLHPTAPALFLNEGFDVETLPCALPPRELERKITDVHILGIRSKTRLSAESLQRAPHLITLGCFCIGTNQVDLEYANKHGIPVFNAPFSSTRSVAELVIAEIIALARQLTDRSQEVHAGIWRKLTHHCHEVRGKTVGIVGYGHIGSQVGVLAEMLGMRVVYHDTLSKLPLGNTQPVSSLEALLGQADFVTLHVPFTLQTHHLIGPHQLAAMRPGSYLLNLSRGQVVDMPALADALRRGHVAGAAIDVYPEEPESNQDTFVCELQKMPNVILTPHIGGSTLEAQAAIGKEVATSLIKFMQVGATSQAVNFPQLELQADPSTHRILNIHHNVPGVLSNINRRVSDLHANIHRQVLATDPRIGCLLMDLDKNVAPEVCKALSTLKTSVRTRILY